MDSSKAMGHLLEAMLHVGGKQGCTKQQIFRYIRSKLKRNGKSIQNLNPQKALDFAVDAGLINCNHNRYKLLVNLTKKRGRPRKRAAPRMRARRKGRTRCSNRQQRKYLKRYGRGRVEYKRNATYPVTRRKYIRKIHKGAGRKPRKCQTVRVRMCRGDAQARCRRGDTSRDARMRRRNRYRESPCLSEKQQEDVRSPDNRADSVHQLKERSRSKSRERREPATIPTDGKGSTNNVDNTSQQNPPSDAIPAQRVQQAGRKCESSPLPEQFNDEHDFNKEPYDHIEGPQDNNGRSRRNRKQNRRRNAKLNKRKGQQHERRVQPAARKAKTRMQKPRPRKETEHRNSTTKHQRPKPDPVQVVMNIPSPGLSVTWCLEKKVNVDSDKSGQVCKRFRAPTPAATRIPSNGDSDDEDDDKRTVYYEHDVDEYQGQDESRSSFPSPAHD